MIEPMDHKPKRKRKWLTVLVAAATAALGATVDTGLLHGAVGATVLDVLAAVLPRL